MAIPLSAITSSAQFKALDPSEQARAIQVAIESGQVQDDRGQAPAQTAPNPRGFLDKFDRQLKGAPMGISNSAARTTAGTAKLLGAPISPEFMSALEPRPGEELGNVAGDIGQTLAGGAALKIPALARTAGTGVLPTVLRAAEQGTKAAAQSGALTGLQTGGDMERVKRDATTGGGIAAALSGLGSVGKGVGGWLARTPFSANTPEQKEILEKVLLPQALGGMAPRGLDAMKATTGAARESAGAAKAAAVASSPRVPRSTFLNAAAEPRSRFTFPETQAKPLDPRNPNFHRFPVKDDAAVMPQYRGFQSDVDENVREWLRTKGGAKGLSMENVDKLRQSWDNLVSDAARAKLADATPKQAVYKAYADSLRNLMHNFDDGKLAGPLTASHRSIIADDMVDKALKADVNIGGTTLKGGTFRKGMGLASLAMAPFQPQVAATTATLAYPMQTGWLLNRAGQASNILSTAPAVRGVQSATQPKSKKKPNR